MQEFKEFKEFRPMPDAALGGIAPASRGREKAALQESAICDLLSAIPEAPSW